MLKRSTLLLVALLTVSMAKAQDVSVSAAFDSTQILLGDQIHFNITVDQPSDLRLKIPFFKDTITRNFEILSGPSVDTVSLTRGRIRIIEKYLVTSFDSGYYRLDPVYAEVINQQGIKRFYSGYPVIKVTRARIAPPDTSMKIFDIVRPYRAPVTLGEVVPWILVAFLTAILIYAAVRLLRLLRKEKHPLYEPQTKDPAHVIAFRELEHLKSENLWQKGETKRYYTRLTEILRQYLEDRFGVFSLELTTSETLEALLKSGFKKDESYNLLRNVLTGADLVKFAKYKPDSDENEISFDNSWSFVSATRLVENMETVNAENIEKSGGTT